MEVHHINSDNMFFLWRSKNNNRQFIKYFTFYQNEKGEEILVSNAQKEYQDMGDGWEYLGTGIFLRTEKNPDYIFDFYDTESIWNREEDSSKKINGW